jgi:hypothetical protein
MNITLHEPAKTVALILGAIPHLVRLLGSDDINIQASAAAVLENITVEMALWLQSKRTQSHPLSNF